MHEHRGLQAVLTGLLGALVLAGACQPAREGSTSPATPIVATPAPEAAIPTPPSPPPSTPTPEPATPTPTPSPTPTPTPTPTPAPPPTPTPTPVSGESKPITLRDKGEGFVTLEATPATREYLRIKGHPPEHIGFVVGLDTHWGDLMVYDLVSLSVLRDSLGRQIAAIGWDALSDDSHHRSGVLFFPAGDSSGEATIPAEGWIELVVLYVADVPERVLRWTVPLFPTE